jgi:nickel transport protein
MKKLGWLLLVFALPCAAHEVHHEVLSTGAVLVQLRYADGRSFSYEGYELYPADKDVPAQVGRTDAGGRVVFIPGSNRNWRLKAFSADGHGVDLRFESPAVPDGTVVVEGGPGRTTLVLFGLSLILGGFGVIQLFIKRREPA